ncbi:CCD81 protein, partial [Chroicocephalus maculipennis]|nr:CCD81 protein [Chroicocephalus maculipennis]
QCVLLPGLGTFAMIREQFQGEEEVFTAQRPVFQLNIDVACLQELTFPTVVIPAEKAVATRHFPALCLGAAVCSVLFGKGWEKERVASKDTILLYSFQLRNGQHLSFAFKDIGVLSCQDGMLCMRFYFDCVTGLESKASHMALLHT